MRDINSANATIRAGAERVAMNAPIQGTAADMIKLAMIRVDEALQKAGLRTRMLLQVHDELLFELPPEEVPQAKALIEEAMKNALELSVPVEVDLAGLTDFDSAALGVCFEWQRRSIAAGPRIRYSNLPPKLATLAALYGVDTMLAAPVHG